VTIPTAALKRLQAHRRAQQPHRDHFGESYQGDFIFCNPDGSLIAPSWLSYTWRNACDSLKLPKVIFHALRHSHASALIAAGLDVVAVNGAVHLIEDLRNRGVSNLHPVGTCRMGAGSDAVVDPRLRVHGISGLRVADASIMPQVVGGNTNAPSIMIGEKAAAMVLEDARSH